MDVGSHLPLERRPPESIEQPPLSLDTAAALMGNVGFLAFRTPADVPRTDSCLMVMIRDAPTHRHFDPQTVCYWILDHARARKEIADRKTRAPLSRSFSWGRVCVEDRFGVCNDFVTFGGWLIGERVATDALLLIFRSAAPILRVRGHSQPSDRLADESLVFFGRLVSKTWTGPDEERFIGSVPPEHLWTAFLLHEQTRIGESGGLREALSSDARVLGHELARANRHPGVVDAGRQLLDRVAL